MKEPLPYYTYAYCNIERYRGSQQQRQEWFRTHWQWYIQAQLYYYISALFENSKTHCMYCGSRKTPEHQRYCNERGGEWFYMDDERKYTFFPNRSVSIDRENRRLVVLADFVEDYTAISILANDILVPRVGLGTASTTLGRIGGCYENSNEYVDIIGNIFTFKLIPLPYEAVT